MTDPVLKTREALTIWQPLAAGLAARHGLDDSGAQTVSWNVVEPAETFTVVLPRGLRSKISPVFGSTTVQLPLPTTGPTGQAYDVIHRNEYEHSSDSYKNLGVPYTNVQIKTWTRFAPKSTIRGCLPKAIIALAAAYPHGPLPMIRSSAKTSMIMPT